MMQTYFAWVLMLAVLAAAYPWSCWLLSHSPQSQSQILNWLLTLSLSVGVLTQLMFWQAVLELQLTLWGVTVPYFLLMLPGIFLWQRKPLLGVKPSDDMTISPRWRWFLMGLIGLISAGILFNAIYWPFSREDTLAIYHRYGLEMYETGVLVPFQGRDEAFYQAYPIQMPLAYTYSYLASGWPNEYLARSIPALFSLGCLPAVYLLGRMLFGRLEGWLAALLLAFAPTFVRWSSTGYVDLPMAFLYTLAAIFAWRLWSSSNWVDALLTGLMMGLAAWTKNAALMGMAFWGLWLVYSWLRGQVQFRHLLLAVVAAALVAMPWYIRNYLEVRLFVPPTAWTDQAERTLSSMLVFITQPENFFITGWLIMVGVGWGIWQLVKERGNQPAYTFLLWWTIPFFGVWWLLVSYDPRFLLLFLPLLYVLAGAFGAALWRKVPPIWQQRLSLPLAGVALLIALYMFWISVEFKPEILRDPLMGDSAKHTIVLGDR